jgi:hypothetical protein
MKEEFFFPREVIQVNFICQYLSTVIFCVILIKFIILSGTDSNYLLQTDYVFYLSAQVFVACRSCPTCKQPFPKTGAIALIMSEYEGLFRRRTERIKREKPNYYDASAFSNRKNPKKVGTYLVYKSSHLLKIKQQPPDL